MIIDYNHESMKQNRNLFLEGKEVIHSIRPEILASWKRTKRYGVDPDLAVFPIPSALEKQHETQEKWLLRKDVLSQDATADNVSKLYRHLESYFSVIFYLDKELNIWLQRGNAECLKMLNSQNIGVGSNLSEELVGTNAVALSQMKRESQYVLGAEHYVECLQPFASIATERHDEFNEEASGYIMMLLPLNAFTPYAVLTLEYFTKFNRATVKNHWINTALDMTQDLLNFEFQKKEEGAIFVDNKEYMISANAWVFNNLGLKQEDVLGSSFNKVFPEFNLRECLCSGKTISLRQVYLPEIDKSVYIKSRPVSKNGSVIGAIVNICDRANVQKIVNKISNHSAYFTFENLIGLSPNFIEAKETARAAADQLSNVLIIGESGTGKELFAQAIHNASDRQKQPFISINCAAIPRELIGSELFGYVEGAFTGARKNGAPGKFEMADKGTVFLDEIGEMPFDMQSVLLRVLEERRVTRLGGGFALPIDVRVIAATNRDLWEMVKEKKFRMDLFYRLNVIRLEIPPLRDRQEDILLLLSHFIKQFNSSLQKNITGYTPDAECILQNYLWPGNIRELRNVVERSVSLSKTSLLTTNDLAAELFTPVSLISRLYPKGAEIYGDKRAPKISTEINERNMISDLMTKHQHNKTRVAQELNISRVTLYKKLKDLNL